MTFHVHILGGDVQGMKFCDHTCDQEDWSQNTMLMPIIPMYIKKNRPNRVV